MKKRKLGRKFSFCISKPPENIYKISCSLPKYENEEKAWIKFLGIIIAIASTRADYLPPPPFAFFSSLKLLSKICFIMK